MNEYSLAKVQSVTCRSFLLTQNKPKNSLKILSIGREELMMSMS